MKLISDVLEESIEYLIESSPTGKKYYLEGVWASAGIPNKNKRVYPKAVMESALNQYDKTYISQKRALGECGHPNGPGINLDRVSHMIENLTLNNNGFVTGRAKVMDTPMGIIVKNLIDEGVKLGVSTRGLGSLKKMDGGLNEVQNDFFISAIDVVADPSGAGCFINGILESVNYEMLEDGRIQEVIIDMHKKKINEEVLLKEFSQLMKILKAN